MIEQPKTRPRDVFARQLRATRERKGWTQAQLAERLKSLGSDLDRSVLAKIESGGRDVSLGDFLALAVALDVAPAALVIPKAQDEKLNPVPNVTIDSSDALLWWWGDRPLTDALPGQKVDVEVALPNGRTIKGQGDSPERAMARRFFVESRTDIEHLANERLPAASSVKSLSHDLLVAAAHQDPKLALELAGLPAVQLKHLVQIVESLTDPSEVGVIESAEGD
jgi:transcriptional regulator with XRE-family HTH domain